MMDWQKAKGWLTMGERALLVALGAEAGEGLILNVGVEYGASMICLRAANPKAKLIGLDLDISKIETQPGLNAKLIQTDSHTYVEKFKRAITVAFIDGDHGYEGVIADCGYAGYIVPGGFLAFHDVYSWDLHGRARIPHKLIPGVHQAVEEWYLQYNADWIEYESVDSIRWFRKRSDVPALRPSPAADLQPASDRPADD